MKSNPVFLAVRPTPTLGDMGWEIHVLDHTDFATQIAVINEYVSLTVSPELDAPGAGSLTIDLDSPFWLRPLPTGDNTEYLRRYEHLFQCYQDGILRFEFLGQQDQETLLSDDETRVVTISGPGAAHVLSWARVLPQGFPVFVAPPSDDPTAIVGVWQWPQGTPAMQMWLELLHASKARGTIPYLNPLFDAATDSAGIAWDDVTTPFLNANPIRQVDFGTDLLAQLAVATGQDLTTAWGLRAHWYLWPGFRLDVRPEIGVHRENEVIFYEGHQLDKQRTRLRDEIANYICVRDDTGGFSFATDADSIATWQQREYYQSESYLYDATRRDATAAVFLEQKRREKQSWTVTVPYDLPGRKAFLDYGVGDWIGVTTFDAQTGFSEGGPEARLAYRVMAITVQVDADGTVPAVELTLETALQDVQRQLQILLAKILNSLNTDTTPQTLDGLSDVNSSTATDGQVLGYDAASKTWKPLTVTGGTVVTTASVLFIQPDDPGTAAKVGDFWYRTG